MQAIPLTQGKVAWIDDEDLALVSQYKWHAQYGAGCWYARSQKQINGRRHDIAMHRLIMSPGPGQVVDHINGNGLDNRKANLRLCTKAENNTNRIRFSSTSAYRGVDWDNRRKKWRARIIVDGKEKHIGYFPTEAEAARAFDDMARSAGQTFAVLNEDVDRRRQSRVLKPQPACQKREIPQGEILPDGTARIPLSKGQFALVDVADLALLSRFRWIVNHPPKSKKCYAHHQSSNRGVKSIISMHRLLMDVQPGQIVDHKNGDGLDNRRCNLRICTKAENLRNSGPYQRKGGKSSSYRGVGWNKQKSKWQALIHIEGKALHLGFFADEIEAARAYDDAAKRFWGEFACPNLPD